MSRERHALAVEMLALRAGDRVLEIGCGQGITAALILAQPGIHYTGIDRSPMAIAAAARRASFRVMTLAAADFSDRRFDKILAVNVNVFWLEPARELAAVRGLLAPGGALCLVYVPPSASQVAGLLAGLQANLAAGGFAVTRVEQRPALVAVTAAPDGGRPRP